MFPRCDDAILCSKLFTAVDFVVTSNATEPESLVAFGCVAHGTWGWISLSTFWDVGWWECPLYRPCPSLPRVSIR